MDLIVIRIMGTSLKGCLKKKIMSLVNNANFNSLLPTVEEGGQVVGSIVRINNSRDRGHTRWVPF